MRRKTILIFWGYHMTQAAAKSWRALWHCKIRISNFGKNAAAITTDYPLSLSIPHTMAGNKPGSMCSLL